jgi:hypothetical protein
MNPCPKPKPHKKRRPKNNPVPKEYSACHFCGRIGLMQTHECFGGNPGRQLSIKYGLQVHLCAKCHDDITHNRRLDWVRELKQWGQAKFEAEYSRDEFRRIFGKSYL